MTDGPQVDLTLPSPMRPPDPSYRDTLTIENDQFANLSNMEQMLDENACNHIREMQRVVDILKKWEAIVPCNKFFQRRVENHTRRHHEV